MGVITASQPFDEVRSVVVVETIAPSRSWRDCAGGVVKERSRCAQACESGRPVPAQGVSSARSSQFRTRERRSHCRSHDLASRGVSLGEAAKRLGHRVETLVTTYVGAIEGDETVANARIEAALTECATGRFVG